MILNQCALDTSDWGEYFRYKWQDGGDMEELWCVWWNQNQTFKSRIFRLNCKGLFVQRIGLDVGRDEIKINYPNQTSRIGLEVGRVQIKIKHPNQKSRFGLEVGRVQVKIKYPNQRSRIGLEVGRLQIKIKYPNQESFWEVSYSSQKQTNLGEPYFDGYHTVVKNGQNSVNLTLIGIIQFPKGGQNWVKLTLIGIIQYPKRVQTYALKEMKGM